MRSKLLAFVLLLHCAWAFADQPVEILISNDSVTIAGVAYKSPADAMSALKKLDPKEVRFIPAQGAKYDAVSATLAYQASGIRADTGFVGNYRE